MGHAVHSLPASLTPLIGREEDVRALVALLDEHRLVTLAGPPGIGKTRLAIEVAKTTTRFAGHVWFVDLTTVADPAFVDQPVATALRVREEPGLALRETVIARLAGAPALLVVDNCEHLIEAAANAAENLLARCPDLSILATSREPLTIAGEWTWRVGPLAVPPDDCTADSTPAAVRLFCDRAKAIDPRFTLSEAVGPAVGEICRRLDGVALAIELAAARVDTLSATQIAERIGDRFGLLTVGSRTAQPRHQTLRSALDWSHELLADDERVLLRRLAVFAGSWSATAAEEVCADGVLERRQVLPLLGRLVAKSLVVSSVTADWPRFRFLETVRDYALEQLAEAGETFEVSARHADWATRTSEEADAQLHGPHHQEAIDTLDADHDNARAALRWALAEGQAEVAMRLATALAMFWGARGQLSEGRDWLLAAARAPQGDGSFRRAGALWGAGYLASVASDWVTALSLVTEALAVAEKAGDRQYVARCLFIQGICALFTPEQGPPVALTRFNRATTEAREAGDAWCMVVALAGVAWIRNVQGDPSTARSLLQECLRMARQAEDREALATSIHLLGLIAMRQGDLVTAEVVLSEAITLARTLGELRLAAEAASSLGEVALKRDDLTVARRLFDEGLGYARSVGTRSAMVDCLIGLGEVARRQGDPTTARSFYSESLSVAWQIGGQCPAALVGLARVSIALGEPWAAEALLDQALNDGARNDSARAEALHEKGDLCQRRGEPARAAMFHLDASRMWAELRDPVGMASALERLAGLAVADGRPEQAARLFGAAHEARAGTDCPFPPSSERVRYDADIALAREKLGETFEMAWDEGTALSTDDAVLLASAEVDTPERPATGWGTLTRAEREVAMLVGESLTNREIGERLFISPRTVQTHLSHVFAKLGFASRRDLARLVARRRTTLNRGP